MFVSLKISISTYHFIGEADRRQFLTDQIILDSFNKLKNEYMLDEVEGEDSP